MAIFAALALQTKPTPTCVRLFLLLFFSLSLSLLVPACRLSFSHSFLPAPLSFGRRTRRLYPKNVIKIYCTIIAPFDWTRWNCSLHRGGGGMLSPRVASGFPAIGTVPECFLLHAIYDGSRARLVFRVSLARECVVQSSGSMGRVAMR